MPCRWPFPSPNHRRDSASAGHQPAESRRRALRQARRRETLRAGVIPGALAVLAACILFTAGIRGADEAATPETPSSGIEVAAAPASKAELLKAGSFSFPSYFEPLPAQETGARLPNGDPATSNGFVYRRNGYTLYLTPSEALFQLEGKGSPIRSERSSSSRGSFGIRLVGANPSPTIEGLDRMAGDKSYFIGNDPSQWRTAVPRFARVRYEQVYPGIDVVYYGVEEGPEYDLLVSPGADPGRIILEFVGVEDLILHPSGDLSFEVGETLVHQRRPRTYQELGRRCGHVEGSYRLLGNDRVGFVVGAYDSTRALVIDPVLTASTYLGGDYIDGGFDVALDRDGNIYVTGLTRSADFPVSEGAVRAPLGPSFDVFVAKLNPSATALEYGAVIGGLGTDRGSAIAVDEAGNAYVCGTTFASDFPVTANALQNEFAGGTLDAFLFRLNADATALDYSSYLGGSAPDEGNDIALDSEGAVYVVGTTISDDFRTTPGSLRTTKTGDFRDGYVVKFGSSGESLLFSTYLGGEGRDEALAVAVDSVGQAHVAGFTSSEDGLTTPNAHQGTLGGDFDAFLVKLDPGGGFIEYGTYLGGSRNDRAQDIAVDSKGQVALAGRTTSLDFPTTEGAYQTLYGGGAFFGDAFVARFDIAAGQLLFSTFLGGVTDDQGNAVAIEPWGDITVVGGTGSSDFPVTEDAVQSLLDTLDEAFLARLSPDGTELLYSTFLGGNEGDQGFGLASDGLGSVVATGMVQATNFPTTSGSFRPSVAGFIESGDAFVTKLHFEPPPLFTEQGVVNAASFESGPVAPGEIITIFGTNLGPPTLAGLQLTADGRVDTSIADTRVWFDGEAAPMIFAVENQLAAVVPYTVAGSLVTSLRIEYRGLISPAVSLPVQSSSPAIFTQTSSGMGPGTILNQDYTLNTPENPALRGSVVILYATGEGETAPGGIDGKLAEEPLPQPLESVSVRIGGRNASVVPLTVLDNGVGFGGALDFGEDILCRSCPDKGLGRLVARFEVLVDGGLEFGNTAEHAAADALLCQLAEPALDEIEPRRRRGNEVKVEAGVLREPLLHLLMLVRGVVVHDQMQLQRRWRFAVDLA